jgi:hypothetical protein
MIPGVVAVIPRESLQANSMLQYKKLQAYAGMLGVGTNDLADFGLQAEQGSTQLSRSTVVIGYHVSQNFMNFNLRPGQEPTPPPELYDQQIQLTIFKYDGQGKVRLEKIIVLGFQAFWVNPEVKQTTLFICR